MVVLRTPCSKLEEAIAPARKARRRGRNTAERSLQKEVDASPMDSFLSATAERAADASSASILRRPVALGGRSVDEFNVNNGLLRCPRCDSRLVSKCGELVQRSGADMSLWVPGAIKKGPELYDDAPDEYEWSERPHEWWWSVGSMDDVDNLGLSKVVSPPCGPLKLAMCVECQYGPVGYQLADQPRIWLACDLIHQQEASAADDKTDFAAPQNIDMAMLQQMIASGMAIVRYHVTFDAQRLGMCLADAADGNGVEVVAFTEADGQLGPAELSGEVKVGDKIARVNGRSASGLQYGDVLDMIIAASRPITIHFERKGLPPGQGGGGGEPQEGGGGGDAVERIAHTEWTSTRQ